MTYPVNFTNINKSPVLVNPNEETNAGLDINLFGRAFTEYGEQLNETLIRLLENFAAPEGLPNQPNTAETSGNILSEPVEGQLWYNTTSQVLYFYNGTRWEPIADRGSISANWGQILDGQQIPAPVSVTGYAFQYSECIWSVSPAEHQKSFDWMVCTTDSNAVVYAKYRGDIDNDVISGIANYLIIGIAGNRSRNNYSDILPTPTPSITPSNTPPPSPTESLAPPTPTPSELPPSDFVGDLFLTSSNGNIDVYRLNGNANPTALYTWNWALSKDVGDNDSVAVGVCTTNDAQYVITAHNQHLRVHTWNPTTPVMTTVAKTKLRAREYFRYYLDAEQPVRTLDSPVPFSENTGTAYNMYIRAFDFGNNVLIILGSAAFFNLQIGTNPDTSEPIFKEFTFGLQTYLFNRTTNTLSFVSIMNNWYYRASVGATGFFAAYEGDFGYYKTPDGVICTTSSPRTGIQININSSGAITSYISLPLNTGAAGGDDGLHAGHAVTNFPDTIRWQGVGITSRSGSARVGVAAINQGQNIVQRDSLGQSTEGYAFLTSSGSAIHYLNLGYPGVAQFQHIASTLIPFGSSALDNPLWGFQNIVQSRINQSVWRRRAQALTINGADYLLFGGTATDVNSGSQVVNGIQVYKWVLDKNAPAGQVHQYMTAIRNLPIVNAFYFVRRP